MRKKLVLLASVSPWQRTVIILAELRRNQIRRGDTSLSSVLPPPLRPNYSSLRMMKGGLVDNIDGDEIQL